MCSGISLHACVCVCVFLLFWENWRFTCSCKKEYRDPTYSLLISPQWWHLCDNSTISQPENWCWYNFTSIHLSDAISFTCTYLCVCCLVLCNFTICVDSVSITIVRTQNSLSQGSLLLPFISTAASLPFSHSLPPSLSHTLSSATINLVSISLFAISRMLYIPWN